jgi:hypothetical protein
VRLAIVLAGIAISAVLGVMPSGAVEQTIEPLTPPVEQHVEMIGGGQYVEQVRAVDAQAVETVEPHVPPSPAAKATSKAVQGVLGVAAAGVALGAMAASLLFL